MKLRKTTLKKRLKKSQYIINELTNKIELYERTIDSQEEEILNLEKYTQELQKALSEANKHIRETETTLEVNKPWWKKLIERLR